MKQIIKNLMKHTRHAKLDSASQVNPLLSLRDTLPQGRGNTLCAKHTVTNLSPYRLNVLKTDKNPLPMRGDKIDFPSPKGRENVIFFLLIDIFIFFIIKLLCCKCNKL